MADCDHAMADNLMLECGPLAERVGSSLFIMNSRLFIMNNEHRRRCDTFAANLPRCHLHFGSGKSSRQAEFLT
jgi:hypothetical protein